MIKYFEEELLKSIDKYKDKKELYEAMKYSLNTGGKRIRPMLTLLCADSLNKDYKDVIDIAIAIEYIHTYSLVHDDLPAMDNDKYRRGMLSTFAKYGEYMGILSGDALLTEAFNILANSKLKNKANIIEIISRYAGARHMVYGQYLDMKYENQKLDEYMLDDIHRNKTGAMIVACFETVLAEYEIRDERYIKIAENLGKIYQLQDDIFDKNNKNDKSNYVNIFGLEKCQNLLNSLTYEMLSLLDENKLKEYIMYILRREK